MSQKIQAEKDSNQHKNSDHPPLPSGSQIITFQFSDLSETKSAIRQALSPYQVPEIAKLLQSLDQLASMKQVVDELSFTEWLLNQKTFGPCQCCSCSCQPCIAMDKGDDMVYFYLKDCTHAYVRSEARLAWEWICYSIALPCLCLVVIPVLFYATGCYCRGCLPNIFDCHTRQIQDREQKQMKKVNDEIIKKIKGLKKQSKSFERAA